MLRGNDISCRQAFRPLGYRELDALALVERLVSVRLDGRIVDKDIVAALASYEPVAFGRIEPLNCTYFSQCFLLLFIWNELRSDDRS